MPDSPEKNHPSSDRNRSSPAVGDTVGQFYLRDLLGEGGMGLVFRAFDDTLHRDVALKLMKPVAAEQAQARDRFLREARSAAAIRSDRIVTIYSAGVADGVPFMAMDLLAGESLDKYLRRSKIPSVPFTVAVGYQVAEGLHAAHTHANKLIHRDIKPANVWLRTNPKEPVDVRLLDFGLARPVAGDSLSVGDVAKIMGTPAYMPPEQWRGKEVDHRADLFSLGVMLYTMATGVPPFPCEDPNDPNQLMFAVCVEPALPEPANRVNSAVPVALAELLAHLLVRDKANRVQSAAEVMRRLDTIAHPPKPESEVKLVPVVIPTPRPVPPPPRPLSSQAKVPTPTPSADPTPPWMPLPKPKPQLSIVPWLVTPIILALAGLVLWLVVKQIQQGNRGNVRVVPPAIVAQ